MADDRMYFCHPATGYAVCIAKMSAMDWSTSIASEAINTLQHWLCNNENPDIQNTYWDYYDRNNNKTKDPFILLFDGISKNHGLGHSWEFESFEPINVDGIKIYKIKFMESDTRVAG